jgi:dipeptidyl aminopeptidase/acylaminoacyl peptidase
MYLTSKLKDSSTYIAATFDAPISSFKTAVITDDTISIVFNAPMRTDATLMNPSSEPKPASSAREFEGVRVRFWDKWKKPYHMSLFYTVLHKQRNGRYALGPKPVVNLLQGVDLEFPFSTGSDIGDVGEYAVSKHGILFTAVSPETDVAQITSILSLYFTPLKDTSAEGLSEPSLIDTNIGGYNGSVLKPAFTADGSHFAFLKNVNYKHDWYSPKRIFIGASSDPANIVEVKMLDPMNGSKPWDRWPEELLWSIDHKSLFCLVQDNARQKLFRVDILSVNDQDLGVTPSALHSDGTVTGVHCFSNLPEHANKLMITSTSFIDSHILSIINANTGAQSILSSLTQHGALLNISSTQVSEFHTTSSKGHQVQHWLIQPPSSVRPLANGKFPIVIFLHGGPQQALLDGWSHRWCPALFAAQGYIVLIPNFTGSSSFGADFLDIVADGGGTPYDDIVAAFDFVEQHVAVADTSRAVAMGGSFGGYMINWIAGQPLAKRLKALVCHDGIFSLTSHHAGDIAGERKYDYGGQIWECPEKWERYDPCRYTKNWTTPMLVVSDPFCLLFSFVGRL